MGWKTYLSENCKGYAVTKDMKDEFVEKYNNDDFNQALLSSK